MGRDIAKIINYIFHTNFLRFTSPSIVNGLQHVGKLYVRADIKTRRILSTKGIYGLLTIPRISINPAGLRNADELRFLCSTN
jgi:hypothetical protein